MSKLVEASLVSSTKVSFNLECPDCGKVECVNTESIFNDFDSLKPTVFGCTKCGAYVAVRGALKIEIDARTVWPGKTEEEISEEKRKYFENLNYSFT